MIYYQRHEGKAKHVEMDNLNKDFQLQKSDIVELFSNYQQPFSIIVNVKA